MIHKIFAVELNVKKRLLELFRHVIPVEISKGRFMCSLSVNMTWLSFEYIDTNY